MTRLADLRPEAQVVCLAARTHVDDEAAGRLRTLTGAGIDWERLWRMGHLHDVLPLLALNLPPVAGGAMPAEWRARAARRMLATRRANEVLAEQLGRVMRGFAEDGVEAMPVKGIVLSETLYGDLALRPAADIDVLVRPVDLGVARAALARLGFRQNAAPTFEGIAHEFHDPAYFVGDGEQAVRLELHRALWAPRLFRLGPEQLWDRAVPGTILGLPVRLLSPEDTLLHLAIHRARSPLRLRWLCDIAELVRRDGATLDWDGLIDRAVEAGAKTSLYTVLSLADALLGSRAPAAALERVAVSRLKRPILERTCGASALFREAAPDDISQQPHLTLRVFEQDGAGRIARALGSSLRRTGRRYLHSTGIARARPTAPPSE